MCGIAGTFLPRGAAPHGADLARMGQVMAHRGPDGAASWESPDRRYAAVFRRLAIIDLDTGDQPLHGADGRYVLTGNGEIYNFSELRRRFADYPYRTRGDMESALAAKVALGDGYLDVLNGMYGLALYDARERSLELVRDRLGIKPLYFAELDGGGIVYGSEIKSLFASGLIDPEIDPDAVPLYLTHGYVPGPMTLFKGVRKLAPGHRLRIDSDGAVEITRYWRARPAAVLPADAAEIERHLLGIMDDSVRLQLRSDVPVGTLLSGGIDSGLIVALAANHLSRPLKTFTVRFPTGVDESPLARAVAERYATEHTVIDVEDDDAADHLWSLAWYLEEPLNDASFLPNYLIERELGRHVTVALNGTGGDELFAGYGRYFQLPIERRYLTLPGPLRDHVIEPLVGTVSPMTAWQLSRAALFERDRGAYLHAHSTHFPPPLRAMFDLDFSSTRAAQADAAAAFAADVPAADRQTAGLAADLETYMVEDLLTLLDRSTMAVSVEGRVPLLDHRLVEAALAVPQTLRTPDDRQKALERRIATNLLPESVLTAPKQGFVSPVPSWFRGPTGDAVKRLLTSKDALNRGWWRKDGIERLLSDPARHAYRAYTLLALELSVRMFTQGDVPLSAPSERLKDIADDA